MTEQINAYRNQFQDSVELALQYHKPKLVGAVMRPAVSGAEKVRLVLRAGRKNTRARLVRNEPLVFGDTTLEQRWMTGNDWDIEPDSIDSLDKIRMGVEPSSWLVMAHAAAIVRRQDQEVIDAFFSTAKVGTDAGSTVSFNSANAVVNGGVNLTVAKLKDALHTLMSNHVDITVEKPCIAMTPDQHSALLADIQATSRDYNGGMAPLVDGYLPGFMGFRFIIVATDAEANFGLPVDGSGHRRCPYWVESGMAYGTWEAPSTSITQRLDVRGHPYQVYTKGSHGATRLDEGKVGEILCVET